MRLSIISSVVVSALALTACGGDDNKNNSTTKPEAKDYSFAVTVLNTENATVFLDANNDGKFDAEKEVSVKTNKDGVASFKKDAAGKVLTAKTKEELQKLAIVANVVAGESKVNGDLTLDGYTLASGQFNTVVSSLTTFASQVAKAEKTDLVAADKKLKKDHLKGEVASFLKNPTTQLEELAKAAKTAKEAAEKEAKAVEAAEKALKDAKEGADKKALEKAIADSKAAQKKANAALATANTNKRDAEKLVALERNLIIHADTVAKLEDATKVAVTVASQKDGVKLDRLVVKSDFTAEVVSEAEAKNFVEAISYLNQNDNILAAEANKAVATQLVSERKDKIEDFAKNDLVSQGADLSKLVSIYAKGEKLAESFAALSQEDGEQFSYADKVVTIKESDADDADVVRTLTFSKTGDKTFVTQNAGTPQAIKVAYVHTAQKEAVKAQEAQPAKDGKKAVPAVKAQAAQAETVVFTAEQKSDTAKTVISGTFKTLTKEAAEGQKAEEVRMLTQATVTSYTKAKDAEEKAFKLKNTFDYSIKASDKFISEKLTIPAKQTAERYFLANVVEKDANGDITLLSKEEKPQSFEVYSVANDTVTHSTFSIVSKKEGTAPAKLVNTLGSFDARNIAYSVSFKAAEEKGTYGQVSGYVVKFADVVVTDAKEYEVSISDNTSSIADFDLFGEDRVAPAAPAPAAPAL